MKAKDLIVKLQKLDPETELVVSDCMGFGCMGEATSGIEIEETRHTEWDHRNKKPVHTTAYRIIGKL